MDAYETVASASAQRRRDQNKLAQRKFRRKLRLSTARTPPLALFSLISSAGVVEKRLEAQRQKQRQHDAAAGGLQLSSSSSGVLFPDSAPAGLGLPAPESSLSLSLPPPPASMLYAGPEATFPPRELVGARSADDLPGTSDLQPPSGFALPDSTLAAQMYPDADPSSDLSTLTDIQLGSDWNAPALLSLDEVHAALPVSTLAPFHSHSVNQQSSASAHDGRTQPSTSATSAPADDRGWISTMHIAAQSGRARIVQRLLSSGVSCEERDNDGRTPLMLATVEGHTEVVCVLVEHGACLEQVDHAGRSVLHLAVWQSNDAIMKSLLTAASQHASSACINAYDHQGWTALHLAIYEGYEAGMAMLLQHGANPNMKAKRCPNTGSIISCRHLQQDLFAGL
nr:isoform 2 of ankyrin repeat domain-containing protein 50 [Quercus suber]